jgi:large subunit ribosomal protein L15
MEQGQVYGKDGFNSPTTWPVTTMDIGAIDQIVPVLLEEGFAQKEGEAVIFNAADIGIEKVLGSGKVTHKFTISAQAFSEQAKAKIEAMGGQALMI